jgi:hypothetical protein
MEGIPEYPTFGWSWRRHRLYEECPRKFWWAVAGVWGGWTAAAGEPNHLAYRLSKLTTLPLLVGKLAHEGMRRLAGAVRCGRRRPAPAELFGPAWEEMVRVRNTDRATFLRDPRRHPILFDAFFRTKPERDITDELHVAGDRLLACLEVGSELPLWDALARAAKVRPPDRVESGWVQIMGDDPFVMWGAPDLAWVHADGRTAELDEFKTGETLDVPRGTLQLHTYAAWLVTAAGARWSAAWTGRLISLSEGREVRVPITRAGLHEAYAMIERDMRTWRLLAESREPCVLPMENFERTGERWRCRSCPFAPVCHEAGNPGGRFGLPEG